MLSPALAQVRVAAGDLSQLQPAAERRPVSVSSELLIRLLAALLAAEVTQREANVERARIQAARFTELKELADFDFSLVASLNAPLVAELARGGWIERREVVLAVGPPGPERRAFAQRSDWRPADKVDVFASSPSWTSPGSFQGASLTTSRFRVRETRRVAPASPLLRSLCGKAIRSMGSAERHIGGRLQS